MNTPLGDTVINAACSYISAGLSVIPIRADGTKAPAVSSWKQFQTQAPTLDEIPHMFSGDVGIAVICGAVSGGLEVLDFDQPGLFENWADLVQEQLPGLLERLPVYETPSGGAHVLFRTEKVQGNQKLAVSADKSVLIETRGTGGYILAAPSPDSCHPDKRGYRHVSGPALPVIPLVTDDERDLLLQLARSFSQIPDRTVTEYREASAEKQTLRPGDDFNKRSTWEDILIPKNWSIFRRVGEVIYWSRPGKDSGCSATTGRCGEYFYNFSSNSAPFEPDTAYSKFSAYTLLNHVGDYKAAARDLAHKGYGTSAQVSEHQDPIQKRIRELASLAPIEYDRVRQKAAKELGIRTVTLDAEVAELRSAEDENLSGVSVLFEDLEPWHEPVLGGRVLDGLAEIFEKYVILPDGAKDAMALWVVHTYAHSTARISPILCIKSPEKRCGKTTILSLLHALVSRALSASNITAAALFRTTEEWTPTLLIDEADTFLKNSDELRGILNSGHNRSSAHVIRTVGEDFKPRAFSTWAPKAIALIGHLPSTLTDRSIVIQMRRKKGNEKVERLRNDQMEDFKDLKRMIIRWVEDNVESLNSADPETPSGFNDRALDNWRPLLAIADIAGSEWKERARKTMKILSDDDGDDDAASIQLLCDIRNLFIEKEADHLTSSELIEILTKMDERPWPEWKNDKPITSRQLAKLLKPFSVSPKNKRNNGGVFKGYTKEQFADAFARYLPDLSATPLQDGNKIGFWQPVSATDALDVADQNECNYLDNNGCGGVADNLDADDQEIPF